MKEFKIFHRRNLPHLQPKGAAFFVTYLLHDALPGSLKRRLQEEHELKLT
jgi:putative transposase